MYHTSMLPEQDLVLLFIRQTKYIFRGQFGAKYTPLTEIYTHSYNTQLWGNPKHTKKPGHKIPKM